MKHIFTIHSPITYFISLGIIESLNINKNDVLLYSNGYNPPFIDYDILLSVGSSQKTFIRKLKEFNVPKTIDANINKIISDDKFTVYADLMSYEQRVLITHPKCEKFHFIEEGLSTYADYDDLLLHTINDRFVPFRIDYNRDVKHIISIIIRALRGFSLRMITMPYNPNCYSFFKDVHFYCFSESCFPHVPAEKKHIIKFDSLKKYVKKLSYNIELNNEVIWIDDSYVKSYNLSINNQKKMERDILNIISSKFNKKQIYIKFRPKTQNRRLIKLVEDNKINYKIIPDNTIIEALLLNSSNCILIGNVSIVLYYASLMGHKSYSIYDRLNEKVPSIYDNMSAFWDKVERI